MHLAIEPEFLTRSRWQLGTAGKWHMIDVNFDAQGNVDGDIFSKILHWRLFNRVIELYDNEGCVIHCLTECAVFVIDGVEYFVLSKELFTSDDRNVAIQLRRKTPNIGCFLRTHYWDDHIAAIFQRLSETWGVSQTFLATDQTKPFRIPESKNSIDHSQGEFALYQLPVYPNNARAMWYNGDYVFYSLALKTNFDYFIICENDLLVPIELGEIARRLVVSGCDFVAPGVRKADENWYWAPSQHAWDNAEFGKPKAAREVYMSFFPFVMISREAALHLFARRICMSLARRRKKIKEWPFCESFVPTELLDAGFKIGPISNYVSGPHHWWGAKTWNEAMDSKCGFVHPVLGGVAFVNKLVTESKVISGSSGIDARSWLREQKERCDTEYQRNLLEVEISAMST